MFLRIELATIGARTKRSKNASPTNVRFGSKADILRGLRDVRFNGIANYRDVRSGLEADILRRLQPVIGPPTRPLLLRDWEPNDAATLWEHQIASDAMSLDA